MDKLGDAAPYEPTFTDLAAHRVTEDAVCNDIGNKGP